jgi:hypothetical protein
MIKWYDLVMKKYTSFLVVFILLFVLLGFNAKPASASTPLQYPYGCSSTQGYSPTTGVKCDSYVNTSLPAGCSSTLGYSPLTGTKCDSYVNTSLPAGCTSTLGYSPLTGVKCDSGGVVPSYPPGCTSNYGYSVTTGQSCGGGYSSVPIISGVSGPQTLSVNQQGTWSVTAYDRNGGNLSYSVRWGDEVYYAYATSNSTNLSIQQSATFTHSYSQAGNYTPTFTVTSENTIRCIQAPCPTNGGSAQTSLSVNVGGGTVIGTYDDFAKYLTNHGAVFYGTFWCPHCQSQKTLFGSSAQFLPYFECSTPDGSGQVQACIDKKITSYPTWEFADGSRLTGELSLQQLVDKVGYLLNYSSITVLSPNGGETWVRGTTQTIQWQDNTPNSSCQYSYPCLPQVPPRYDISLFSYPTGEEFNLAREVSGSSFNWVVGTSDWSPSGFIKDGYGDYVKIRVYKSNTVYDSSDNYFKITNGTTTSTTTITSISPTSAKVGDIVTIYGLNFDTVAPFIYLTNGYLAKVLTPITSSSTQISFSVPSDLSVGAYTVQAISRANSTSSDNSVYFTVVAATTPTSISVVSPSAGATLTSGSSSQIMLSANATSITNPIVKIQLLQNNVLLGSYVQFYLNSNGPSTTWIVGKYYDSNNNFLSATPGTGFQIQAVLMDGNSNVTITGSSGVFMITSGVTTQAPTISYLSPSSGVVDSTFTINGNDFTLTGNAVNFGFGYIPDLTSASGNQIIFTVPESLDLRCRFSNPPCMTVTAMTQPGNYNVSVSNMNGTSNILNFTVVGNVLGATAFHFTLLLQLGSSGNEVTELQKFLNATGYDAGVADGNFGAKTQNAVVQFQIANGLVGDGVVGALTRAVLNR